MQRISSKEKKYREQGRRLQRAREQAGYRSARLAALRNGWKYPTYAAHELGGRALTPNIASKYAAAFSVHPEFLLFGSSPPEWWEDQPDLSPVVRPIRLVSLGSWADVRAVLRSQAATKLPFVDDEKLPPGAYALEVSNDEMNPKVPVAGECSLAPGDLVVVDPKCEVKPGQIAVVKAIADHRASLRKVRLKGLNQIEFVPLNPDYPSLTDDEVEVLGRVAIHIRYL